VRVRWTSKALGDLARLHAFLAESSPRAAAAVVLALTKGAGALRDNPRIGFRLAEFEPRDVRRVILGQYELRYELGEDVAYVLRLWHTREDR
jgi:plasmid stabilization system protein ParE